MPAPAGAAAGRFAPVTSASPAAATPERIAREVAASLSRSTAGDAAATGVPADAATAGEAATTGEAATGAAPATETAAPLPDRSAAASALPGQAEAGEPAPGAVAVAIAGPDQRRPPARPALGAAEGAADAPALSASTRSAPVQTTPAQMTADQTAPAMAGSAPSTPDAAEGTGGAKPSAAVRLAPMPPRRSDPGRTEVPRGTVASGSAKAATAALPAVALARPAPGTPGMRLPDQYVCRDPRLAGTAIPAIGGPGTICGISQPVRLTAIDGIRFDTPATVDCPTARRIAHWLSGVAMPLARSELGSRIVEIDVMGSYACRTRNNRPGGRLSEHALGRALDVGGFRLADGRQVSVKDHWGSGQKGRFLKRVHRDSCGLFMTVLGPNSDRYHHDHFHLDTAERRGTPYCR